MELMKSTQAAQFLGISPRQFMRLVDKGEVPYYKLGESTKGFRFDKADLTNFLKRRKTTSCLSESSTANVVPLTRSMSKSASEELDALLKPSSKRKNSKRS